MSLTFLISDHGPYALSGERVKDKESEESELGAARPQQPSDDCAVALALAVQDATTERPRRQIAFAFG
jgi:hypothetical protein